ncbi:hypothetical protein DYI37_05720 [Fulvimarina endophytica]|uniref:Uncharacterized protein n=1 Tax=Fulvimarina endophytica TaxID=2293836 RepID=A0A371X7V3_9HYPH|nr:hypothetical protein [Fulvimarina endophytica]RFC65329.1 hypothetical protein DYI37_05720 [Fulvimarina endophytica]
MAQNGYNDPSTRKASSGKGMFRNALDRMIEARERQARAYVRNNLALYGRDMESLRNLMPVDPSGPTR